MYHNDLQEIKIVLIGHYCPGLITSLEIFKVSDFQLSILITKLFKQSDHLV